MTVFRLIEIIGKEVHGVVVTFAHALIVFCNTRSMTFVELHRDRFICFIVVINRENRIITSHVFSTQVTFGSNSPVLNRFDH